MSPTHSQASGAEGMTAWWLGWLGKGDTGKGPGKVGEGTMVQVAGCCVDVHSPVVVQSWWRNSGLSRPAPNRPVQHHQALHCPALSPLSHTRTKLPKTDMSTPPPRPGSVLQRHGSGLRLVHTRTKKKRSRVGQAGVGVRRDTWHA